MSLILRRAFLRRMAFAAMACGLIDVTRLPVFANPPGVKVTLAGVPLGVVEEGLNGWRRYAGKGPDGRWSSVWLKKLGLDGPLIATWPSGEELSVQL